MTESAFAGMEPMLKEFEKSLLAEINRSTYMWMRWTGRGEPATYSSNINLWQPFWPWAMGAKVKAKWAFWAERVRFAWEVLWHGHECPED